jgi:hypothetical protein
MPKPNLSRMDVESLANLRKQVDELLLKRRKLLFNHRSPRSGREGQHRRWDRECDEIAPSG